MVFPMYFWLLFAAAMLISAIGFKKYVWFISLGYGFSIAGEGLVMLALFGKSLDVGTAPCLRAARRMSAKTLYPDSGLCNHRLFCVH